MSSAMRDNYLTGQNIICIPFAFKEGANSGVNIADNAYVIYLKNACVALCSAKHYNPESEVCFATNVSRDNLPSEYLNVLINAGISIVHVPYDAFTFPDEYKWSLAFYKLCVLKYLVGMDYENICYMDTDVYIQGSFEHVWEECKQNILLYNINHGLNVRNYRILCDEVADFLGTRSYITHYGGEFFAASTELAKSFCEECESIYSDMVRSNYQTTKGDEFILSIAADRMRTQIKNASAYICRFWTAIDFRLVSTCYEYNRIVVLHMPNEKNEGIIVIYDLYIRKGRLPSDNTVWKTCRLRESGVREKIKIVVRKLLNR